MQGGVQLTVTPANPALAFLQQVQQCKIAPASLPLRLSPPAVPPISPAAPSLGDASTPSQWTRVEVLPGLELHIRHDFVYPSSTQEQQTLLQLIRQILLTFAAKRRSLVQQLQPAGSTALHVGWVRGRHPNQPKPEC